LRYQAAGTVRFLQAFVVRMLMSWWCAASQLKHPSYITWDYGQMLLNTNSAFVLQARASLVQLKGQIVPTTITPAGDLELYCCLFCNM